MTNDSPLNSLPPSSGSKAIGPIGPDTTSTGRDNPLTGLPQEGAPGGKQFSLGTPKETTEKAQSPMDLSSSGPITNTGGLQQPTLPNLIAQANAHHNSLLNAEKVLRQGNYPAVSQFKSSHAELLSNYLSTISEHQSFISNKLKVPLTSMKPSDSPAGSIGHYLNYVAGSQVRMAEIAKGLGNVKHLTQGDPMAVQIKMNSIQQQVEFFSSLLGKALSAISTILSVQN